MLKKYGTWMMLMKYTDVRWKWSWNMCLNMYRGFYMLTTAILRLTVFCENYFVYIKWFHGLYNYNLHVVFKIWGCSVGKSLKHGLHVPNISIYYQYIIMFWITNAHCFWRWNWFAPFWDYFFLGGGDLGLNITFVF